MSGIKLTMTKTVEVEAKTLKIYSKICDQFTGTLEDSDGEVIAEWDNDYVPSFLPEQHYGDYLILDIDLETGQILNWKKPTREDLERYIKNK